MTPIRVCQSIVQQVIYFLPFEQNLRNWNMATIKNGKCISGQFKILFDNNLFSRNVEG